MSDLEETTMTLAEVYEDLVGVAEVAEQLGVQPHRVRRWIERREATNCPRPVRELKLGHLFSMSDWRGWFALWKVTRGSWISMPENTSHTSGGRSSISG